MGKCRYWTGTCIVATPALSTKGLSRACLSLKRSFNEIQNPCRPYGHLCRAHLDRVAVEGDQKSLNLVMIEDVPASMKDKLIKIGQI